MRLQASRKLCGALYSQAPTSQRMVIQQMTETGEFMRNEQVVSPPDVVSLPDAAPGTMSGAIATVFPQPAQPMSRRGFLVLGAAGAGAAVVASTMPAQADILDTLKRFLDLDDIVLNYAHELEELQATFFERAIRSTSYQQLEARERGVFNAIAMQDRAQFEALEALRGRRGARGGNSFQTPNASASRRPRVFKFPGDAFTSREKLLPMAVDIKESSVAAYHGAVDLLRSKRQLLTPAAAIAGVDGRHLAVLREIAGMDPIPMSFELQISPQTIGNKLGRYGFKGGGMRGGLIS